LVERRQAGQPGQPIEATLGNEDGHRGARRRMYLQDTHAAEAAHVQVKADPARN
jgi:hypothetical protein